MPTASSPETSWVTPGARCWAALAVSWPPRSLRPFSATLYSSRVCRSGFFPSSRWFLRCCSKPSSGRRRDINGELGVLVQLGGYNGMTGIPAFQIGDFVFSGYSFFYLALGLALICYLGCRMLVNSRHGKVMLAIREDAVRTEMLGYDIRMRQWLVFVLASLLAALSGLLYVQWGNYITPSQVGLLSAALPVIWVAVGGREKLLAVVMGAYGLNWLNYRLSSSGNQYALVIIGALLVIVMLFFPRGLVVTLADLAGRRSAPAEASTARSRRSSPA